MNIPKLVLYGLNKEYESGYNSAATNMLYKQIKKTPEEISQIIRETWKYVKENNIKDHVLSHFLYLLKCEVGIEWIRDISLDIFYYSLTQGDTEVIDNLIGLIDEWNDKALLDSLYNVELKEDWLKEYRNQVLKEHGYINQI